jgi:Phospholipase_D-nuclease N-terminal
VKKLRHEIDHATKEREMPAEYGFGELMWTMLAFFFWFMLIWMFIAVFADIFRRRDLSGGAKAGWILLIFILPLFGILIYVIARPTMTEQDREMAMSAGTAQGSSGYSSSGHVG